MATYDISDHYTLFHNTESVTVTLKRNAGNTDIVIDNAMRSRLSRSEQLTLSAYLTGDELVWFLPGDQVTSNYTIYEGDVVTDSSNNAFTVSRVRDVRMGDSLSGYRCIVTPER